MNFFPKHKRKRGQKLPNTRLLYAANQRFFDHKTTQLVKEYEIIKNIDEQIARNSREVGIGCFIILSIFISLFANLFTLSIFYTFILFIQVQIGNSSLVYVYGFIKFTVEGRNKEELFHNLLKHENIATGKITRIYKFSPSTERFIEYQFRTRWKVKRIEKYIITTDTKLKVNDKVSILYNELVSIIL